MPKPTVSKSQLASFKLLLSLSTGSVQNINLANQDDIVLIIYTFQVTTAQFRSTRIELVFIIMETSEFSV